MYYWDKHLLEQTSLYDNRYHRFVSPRQLTDHIATVSSTWKFYTNSEFPRKLKQRPFSHSLRTAWMNLTFPSVSTISVADLAVGTLTSPDHRQPWYWLSWLTLPSILATKGYQLPEPFFFFINDTKVKYISTFPNELSPKKRFHAILV